MKQTEVGLIPDDWEVKKLSDVSDIKAPMVNPLTRKYDFLPHIGNENIEKFTGKLLPYNLVGEDQLISGKYYFKSTDVLYGKINPQFSKVAFPEFEGLCSADMYPLSVKEGMIPLFLKYSLLTKSFYEYTVSSSTRSGMPKVNRNEISGYLFAVPPLPEQQRIAKALSDVDTLISTTEKLIQKKKNIKQGTMQNLLTGKKRLPGFGPQTKSPDYKQTELGPIPEDWEVKTLNELINDISDGPFGSNLKTEHYTTEREVRIIQLSNVGEDGWDNENVKYTTFTHAKEIQRCIVPYGSIVIAKMMPAGRSILCPNQEKMYILGSDCVRITPNSLLDSLFFMYFSKTSFYLNQIKENTQGSTRARTSVSKLKRIEIALPSKEEQTAIANVLSSMDKEIEALNTKLEKYRNLKTAMMQQLLTGKIRLVK